MPNNPLVSVVVPVYNGERFLRETIDSILQQTYSNLEVIIIDDASTDHSREIIDSYQDDRIIKIYNEKNENVCGSSNKGFVLAKGEYCALIGHDDVWHKDKIEKQIAYLEENKECAVCFSRCDIIDQMGTIINEAHPLYEIFRSFEGENQFVALNRLYLRGNGLCAPSAIIRMDVLREVGLYDYASVQLQDYELWMRILTKHPIHVMEESLLNYRQILDTSTNLSAGNPESITRHDHELVYIREKILYFMSDECFKNTFSPGFRNANASSAVDFMCERMFLLKRMNNPYWNKRAMELINDEKSREVLETQYGFTLPHFYKMNSEIVFRDRSFENKNEKPVVVQKDATGLIKYLDAYISMGKVELSKQLFEEVREMYTPSSEIATMWVLYKIYDLEKEMQEESFFNGKGTVKELVEYYDALKFLLRRFEFLESADANEFVEFVVENKVSSSAIMLAVEVGIIDKKKVLNEAALALFRADQRVLAVRLLNCAYRSFNDDETKYNLANVLYCCGKKELAKQVLDEIVTMDEKAAELKARLRGV